MTTLRLEPILLLYLLPLGLIVWGFFRHDWIHVIYQDSEGANQEIYYCPHCGELKDV